MSAYWNNEAFLRRRLRRAQADRDEARRQLAEAAECVRLLLAFAAKHYWPDEEWEALPAWMRKEIER